MSRSGDDLLSRKALAPARSAPQTYSSYWKVVRIRIRESGHVDYETSGGLDPVDAGHPDVHEDHVRPVLDAEVHGLQPVLRLGDDSQVGRGAQNDGQARPKQRIVVGKQHLIVMAAEAPPAP